MGQQETGTLEAIRCKILALGEERNPQNCRIELTSEKNIFFHFTHTVDEHDFRIIQEDQKLTIDFQDYASLIIKMLNQCIKEPNSYCAVFAMQQEGPARLNFIHNLHYKFVELLSCNFDASPEEMVRQQITFRYNSNKKRLESMEARVQAINAFIKVKNPSLLLQLKRMHQRMPQNAGA